MRMKFNKSRQLVLVSAASLLAATLVTACSQFTQTLTVDYVYVASSKAAVVTERPTRWRTTNRHERYCQLSGRALTGWPRKKRSMSSDN